ncbi:MAG: PEP-CTERM sorting domain-containing protein [Planctomycetes bacterium]|nr:PEP-CTERM sorting domain-containing protein [Planctomycetota bacterium]
MVTVGATPIPNFSEMSLFPTVRNSITGTAGYNLNTAAGGGIGETMSGDMTFAYQWNQSIGDRGSFGVSTDKVMVVPEPASMIALGLGVAALLRRRKKK